MKRSATSTNQTGCDLLVAAPEGLARKRGPRRVRPTLSHSLQRGMLWAFSGVERQRGYQVKARHGHKGQPYVMGRAGPCGRAVGATMLAALNRCAASAQPTGSMNQKMILAFGVGTDRWAVRESFYGAPSGEKCDSLFGRALPL